MGPKLNSCFKFYLYFNLSQMDQNELITFMKHISMTGKCFTKGNPSNIKIGETYH